MANRQMQHSEEEEQLLRLDLLGWFLRTLIQMVIKAKLAPEKPRKYNISLQRLPKIQYQS